MVIWKSKKKNGVARSSAKTQYRAMTKTSNELVWIKMLLEELHLTIIGSTRLWCDNLTAMLTANTSFFP